MQERIDARSAEAVVGCRLDRRRAYCLVDGTLCLLVTWTDTCSGCFEGGECMGLAHHYGYDDKAGCHVGAGCDECGYTGKRRRAMWVPITAQEVRP